MFNPLLPELENKLRHECAQIHTVGDLELYAQMIPNPIGEVILQAIYFFSEDCLVSAEGTERKDWAKIKSRQKLGCYFQWLPETPITKDLYWPLSTFILQSPDFRRLGESEIAAHISEKEGYGSTPPAVIILILELIYKKAPYLTRKMVVDQIKKVRKADPDYVWGKGELKNHVLESLLSKYKFPFQKTIVGEIPDWNNNEVQALNNELVTYAYLFD